MLMSYLREWQAVREISTYSLTAGFISWGHRTLIQNLLSSKNSLPRERWLDDLLNGELSGGTGLSNAVKFLLGIEELQVTIVEEGGKRYLQGRLPWITNLKESGFITIFAAEYADSSKPPVIIVLPYNANGVTRTKELSLVALQGSNTVAIELNHVELDPDWIIAENAGEYLAQVRPTFLGLQSLDYVDNRSVLKPEYDEQVQKLANLERRLAEGLNQSNFFIDNPKALFDVRIEIVDVVASSLLLELQASGGRGYLQNAGSDFIRRWREGAFLPVVTPSVLQLKTILQAAK